MTACINTFVIIKYALIITFRNHRLGVNTWALKCRVGLASIYIFQY